jgi:RHS repeat-associated protein
VRLDGVGNNRGYLVDFLYAAEDIPLGSQPTDWLTRTAAVGINRAVDYCDPYAPCTLSRNWPSVTYTAAGFGGGDPVEVTDQSSRTTTYTYGGFGLSGIRLPGSTADDRSVTYGTGGRVASVTDASGTWTYAYSDVGTTRTTTVTGPLNQELVVVSDQTIGRATSVTDALSNTTSYQYADGRLTRITSPEGNYTEYDYDTRGNVVEVIAVPKSGSGLSNQTTTMTYPGSCSGSYTTANCNKPLTVEDPRGNVTTYAWSSSHGGPTSITSPAVNGVNAQTRYAYAAFNAYYKNSVGNIVASASAVTLPIEVSACATADDTTGCDGTADEVLTTVTYGSTGVANNLLPTQVAQGSGASPNMAVTAMTYTPNGDVETVDGPLSGTDDTTRYRYDDARQMVGVVGPDPDGTGAALNRAQRMTYNLRGQVTLSEQGTTTGYSDTQWAAFITLQKAAQAYDGYGRPTRSEAQAADGTVHALAQVSYDAAGRPECHAVRMNPTVFGTVTSNACAAGTTGSFGPDRIVQATYDDMGRPVTTTAAYGLTEAITESVSYTDNGLPETLTDGEGNASIVEYDGFDRAAKLRYPNATGGGTSTTDYETWAYDAASNVTEYRNRSGQTFGASYDALNRASLYGLPTLDQRTLEYDNLGRLTDLYTTGFFAWYLTWTYDPLGRPLTQGNAALGTLTSEYDAAGRRTRLTWPDSYYAVYDFDLYGGLTAVRENGATSGAGVLATYAYDNLGRRTGVTRGNGVSSTYGYDTVSRLASLSHDPAGTGQDVTISFTHNPASQVVGRTVSNPAYVFAPNSGATSYVNDDLNRVASAGGISVTYDTRGNITSGPGGTYGYDAENNLTSAGSTNFAFDPLNRLYGAYGTTTTRFLYDGLQAVAEFPATGSTPTARHVPGVGLDDVVTSYVGSGTGTRTWLLADERQSVIGLADGSGAAGVNAYDEYGVPASGNAGRFQYTGQMWLPDAGLYHYRARAYAPDLGRFMQTDPIRYGAGANLYAYVGADPVNFTDPLGLECTPLQILVARLQGATCVDDIVVQACDPGRILVGDRCEWRDELDDVIRTGGTSGGSTGVGGTTGPRIIDEVCTAGRPDPRLNGLRDSLENVALGSDVATVGALAGGVSAPLVAATEGFGLVVEGGIFGVNVYDGFVNDNWVPLGSQVSGLGGRLFPGGRALQSSLKFFRGPTGPLRDSRGRYRTSHLNNRGINEAGQVGSERAFGAVISCP